MSIKSTFQGGQGKKSKALPGPLGTLETKMVTCDGKHSIFRSTYTIIIIIVAYSVY